MYIARVGGTGGAAAGGLLAVTGTDSLYSWYALLGIAMVVSGLVLLRVAMLRRRPRSDAM